MPLLKSNKDTSTQTQNTADNNTRSSSSSPSKKRSIFSGRRRSSSSGGSGHGSSDRNNSGHGSSDHNNSGHRNSGHRTSGHRTFGSGFFGRGRDKHLLDNDQSIINARQGVSDAETAEREADRALVEARNRVKFAYEHVRNLEQEAIEEWVTYQRISGLYDNLTVLTVNAVPKRSR